MTTLSEQFIRLVKETLTDDKNDIQTEVMDESAKSPNFFHDNNNSNKPERKHTTTRLKSRHFLSNISYVGINKEDFYNENFILDVYLLVTINLNPFSLDRELNNQNKHQMICMLWKECMSQHFYKYVCKDKNFLYLNDKSVLQTRLPRVEKQFITVQR